MDKLDPSVSSSDEAVVFAEQFLIYYFRAKGIDEPTAEQYQSALIALRAFEAYSRPRMRH